MRDLTGKVAIVTGASAPNGIGRASAMALAEKGAAVLVTDVAGEVPVEDAMRPRLALLDELVAEIEAAGGKALAMECDVTRRDQIQACVDHATGRLGGLDILVNNAGTTTGTGPFLEATEDQWALSYRVNLAGPMMFSQAAIAAMRKNAGGAGGPIIPGGVIAPGGVIINVGSTGSLGAEAGFGAYTAMKHGLVGLTKTIAAEFGPENIRCNIVCPGYVATDMHEGANRRIAAERGMPLEDIKAERYAGVALRRAGTPAEVAAVIAFLASPAAAYLNGAALPVSGGTPVGL
ncbi:MAG: SDR family oxidoreductase [Pseudomonadota bacterium]